MSCLEEGDATLSSVLYAQAVFGPAWQEAFGSDGGEGGATDTTPPYLRRYFDFDYDQCLRFVSYLYLTGGWSAVDLAYKDPPSTTQQILHPEKYEAGVAAKPMSRVDLSKRLGSQWERRDTSVFGEFDVYNYLVTILGNEDLAAHAAQGWAAGWGSVYLQKTKDKTSPDDVLVHIALQFGSPADLQGVMTAYAGVVNKVSGGQFTLESSDGAVCWHAEREYGYVAWDKNEDTPRVDIVISTAADARKAATLDVLTVPKRSTCPA